MNIGVLQSSILAPLFFDILIRDFFLLANKSEICSYAYDSTLYAATKNIKQIISKISNDSGTLKNGFLINIWYYSITNSSLVFLNRFI